MPQSKSHPQRNCLVTVGATVGFKSLTDTVLDPDFWHFLASNGFTGLRVQCGPDIEWASARVSARQDEVPKGMKVDVFETCKNLMTEEMALCKPAAGGDRVAGIIIAHAGTGTILDAWKVGVPLIVVPNTELLNDHQTEMAKHLAREGYATHSNGTLQDLKDAITKSDTLQQQNKTRWQPHSVDGAATALRLWDISPVEVQREQNVQMAND